MDEKRKKPGRRRLPVICGYCGAEAVVALRNTERVLIRCEACGTRLFAYYTDPDRRQRGAPPRCEDAFFVRQVERDLLREVTRPAQALYEFIRRYIARHGYAPTLREMQTGVGWQSVTSVRHHLKQLERVGLIERDYGAARGIRLVHVA